MIFTERGPTLASYYPLVPSWDMRFSPFRLHGCISHVSSNTVFAAEMLPSMKPFRSLKCAGFTRLCERRHADLVVLQIARNDSDRLRDPTTLLQSLLLLLRATTTKDAQPTGQSTLWLKVARDTLDSILSSPVKDTDKPLLRRLWWACAEAEHLFFLTLFLENNNQPRMEAAQTLLDCSATELPSLRDLDEHPFTSSWAESRLRQFTRWAAYLERMRLWRQLSALLRSSPTNPKPRVACLHHDELFWKLQPLTDEFEKGLDEQRGGLGLGNEGDSVATAMRQENVAIYSRLVLAHLTSSLKFNRRTDADGEEAALWRGLETRRALTCVQWTIEAGDGALATRATPWLTGRMLRALIGCVHVIRGTSTPTKRQLLRRLTRLLEVCLKTHEGFWMTGEHSPSGPVSPVASSTDLEQYSEDVLTPEQMGSSCPGLGEEPLYVAYGSDSPGEVDRGDEHLRAQGALMKSFDNMWNENLVGNEQF